MLVIMLYKLKVILAFESVDYILLTLKSCKSQALERSQRHLETQMECGRAPKQCFSGNLQDKIAENT